MKISSGNLNTEVTSEGLVSLREINGTEFIWPVNISASLKGCEVTGKAELISLPGGGAEIRRLMKYGVSGFSAYLTERFLPAGNSIRCELEIRGTGDPWTTEINSGIYFKANASSGIWIPWGDSRISKDCLPDHGITVSENRNSDQNWTDPLLARNFFNDTLFYGAPYFRYDNPGIAFIPFQWDLFCIPMVSLLESKADKGISIILNPDEDILDLTMQVKENGTVIFSRLFNRISDKNILKFSFDIVAHEADWRGGLRWMSAAYPEYFEPANQAADKMAGMGGYSDSDVDFDVAKMKKMNFSVNWRASFDFPYMGIFIPPVEENETWTRFGGSPTSVSAMQNYAEKMKSLGFHVLSYFNVTEFGARMKYPLEPVKITKEADLWKSANDFLCVKLDGSLLHIPWVYPRINSGFMQNPDREEHILPGKMAL
ncbi:MAG: hypothetical protein IPJ37_17380 [Bacteroidales bacterium]|nr:hypothetical protein [Bacteroidales bacterium]